MIVACGLCYKNDDNKLNYKNTCTKKKHQCKK